MSDEININAENEALRLLSDLPISVEDLARALRLEPDELLPLLAEPSRMNPLTRMRVALVLREHVARTPWPELSAIIADALWNGAMAFFQQRFLQEIELAALGDPAQIQQRLAAFLVRELGPEILEHMPPPPGTPNT